jgi:hypothetical protein
MHARNFLGMKKQPQFNFDTECNFSDLPKAEREAACKYEYMRESQALRDKVKANKEPDSIAPEKYRANPYLRRLSRLCKANCPGTRAIQTPAKQSDADSMPVLLPSL